MIQPRTILCIDDACTFLQVFRTHFEDRGYRVLTASSGKEGLELLAAKRVDAVILDYQMPGMTSAAALQVSKRVSPGTLVVILSGAATTVPQGARRAATTVLLKYKSMPRLMHSIEGFLEDKLQKLDSAAELTVGKQFGKVRREVPALRSGK